MDQGLLFDTIDSQDALIKRGCKDMKSSELSEH